MPQVAPGRDYFDTGDICMYYHAGEIGQPSIPCLVRMLAHQLNGDVPCYVKTIDHDKGEAFYIIIKSWFLRPLSEVLG